ncbi:MAG: transposase [Euryarchaeota archaeon]|nr:transposase [Euryarchaeota archaeon]
MPFVRKIKTKSGTYLVEVENTWQNGKVIQKHIRMVGKVTDKGIVYNELERSEVKKVLSHANVLALHKIASDIGIEDILGENSKQILALAYAHCIEPRSINSMKILLRKANIEEIIGEEITPKKLRDAVQSIGEKDLFKIEMKLFERIQSFYSEINSIVYDVTRIYFYGTKCKLAKPGYNPRHAFIPQINISLAVTMEHSFPIFHDVFPGNVYDSKTLLSFLAKLNMLGIRNKTLIIDRGSYSEENVGNALESGFEVIAGVPLRGEMKEIAREFKEKIADAKNRLSLKTVSIYAKEIRIKNRKFVVCLNEEDRTSRREARRLEIDQAIERLSSGLPIKEGIKKYLIKTKEGFEINYDRLREAEEFDGIYLILSTKEISKGEIVKAYFEKDKIEKAFRCLKSVVEVAPVRHRICSNVYAHIFICYLAYLLLSLFEYKLEKAGLSINGRKLTAKRALEELETVYKVEIEDPITKRSFSKIITLNKLQEKILRALKIKLHSVKTGQT